MLFVWDIHSTRKTIHPCIEAVEELVARNSKDDVIVFVWDYVYHFNYDRVALHALFSYWVELVNKWKKLFILAWNHDWIQNQFVFAEWQLAFDTLQSTIWLWSIEFITKPIQHNIQWRDILFFPYTTQFENAVVRSEYEELNESSNAKERLSWVANSTIHTMIDEWKQTSDWSQKLLVVHHWYIAKVAFPWQFAKFGYWSPALSNHWLDDDQIMMLSWHLHQPFIERNYCCVGSLRSTSPLEINQQKYLFALCSNTRSLIASPVRINPYYQAELEELSWWVDVLVQNVEDESKQHLQSPLWNMEYDMLIWESWNETTTLTVITDQPGSLDAVDDDIKQQIGTLRQKQSSQTLGTLITSMQESSKELDKSFSDRKMLLNEFLSAKYGDRKDQYIKDLEALGVI